MAFLATSAIKAARPMLTHEAHQLTHDFKHEAKPAVHQAVNEAKGQVKAQVHQAVHDAVHQTIHDQVKTFKNQYSAHATKIKVHHDPRPLQSRTNAPLPGGYA